MTSAGILGKMLEQDALKDFLAVYNRFTTLSLTFATIAVVVLIVFHITKLAKAADDARERQMAISGLAVCSVCFAILGGIDIVYAILLVVIVG